MRTRLRPGRTPDEELEFYSHRYPHGYRHKIWPDHVERVAASAAFIDREWSYLRPIPDDGRGPIVADLSCGDAALASRVQQLTHAHLVLSDLVDGGLPEGPATTLWYGPLHQTVGLLEDGEVDLFVCSETLEHMDDPEALLRQIRPKTSHLFVSTPLGETSPDNPEHYWGWDQGAVHDMLTECGFTPTAYEAFTPSTVQHYTFQFWMCS